ncbi:Gfo/Idh/MocA family oxidoreductase [Kineococcus sp. NPDC059986]|uniref:Gfo/Idh/MocA family protein n=1 Tax=Kineococcus sp. NPDC059986 TaxID=3155538 RepID=UPI00344FDAAB
MRRDPAAGADGSVRTIAVLGCADIARRRVLPVLSSGRSRWRLTHVASRDPATAAALAAEHGARPASYDQVLEDPAVDAVYLPLPNALHAPWARRALSAGKHVLAEKPLTGDAATSRGLLDQARAGGLALEENVLFVHHRQTRVLRRLVQAGAVGRVRAVTARFCVPARPAGDVRHRRDLGGGALLDTGVYPLRAALTLLGRRLEVVGAVLDEAPGGVDLGGSALLLAPDGATASVTFGMAHGYVSDVEVHGEEGLLRLASAFTPGPDAAPELDLLRGGRRRRIRLAPHDHVRATLDHFAAAVDHGTSLLADDVLAEAELLDAVRRHARRPAPSTGS